jgi:hypothetical protein
MSQHPLQWLCFLSHPHFCSGEIRPESESILRESADDRVKLISSKETDGSKLGFHPSQASERSKERTIEDEDLVDRRIG